MSKKVKPLKFNIGRKDKFGVSADTFEWFNKLTLTEKLRCIEEQIKTIYYFRKLKIDEKHIPNRNDRNNKKV